MESALSGIRLELVKLQKSFGNIEILRDINLEINPGEFVLEFRLSRSKSAIALRLANSSQERQWSLATSYQAQP